MKMLISIFLMGVQIGCGSGGASASQFVPRSHLFPQGNGVLIGQVFDDNVSGSDKAVIMWGAESPRVAMYQGHYVIFGFYDETLSPRPPPGPVDMAEFNTFSAAHPTWIEYQCNRKTPAWNPGWYYWPVDIANATVRKFLFDEYIYPLLAQGYNIDMDNTVLDNYTRRCGHFDVNGHWIRQYSGNDVDSAYAMDVLTATADFAQMIHTYSPSATLAINTFPPAADLADILKLSHEVDLSMDESGVTGFGKISVANIDAEIKWELALASKGECFWTGDILGSGRHPLPPSPAQRNWDVANYLLTKGSCSYLTIDQPPGYGYVLPYPEASVDYGVPLDTAIEQKDGTWIRHYSNATIKVDPETQTAQILMIRVLPTCSLSMQTSGGPASVEHTPVIQPCNGLRAAKPY